MRARAFLPAEAWRGAAPVLFVTFARGISHVSEEFDSLRATLTALQQYFLLSLPRQEVLNRANPAAAQEHSTVT